ncbi:MAG: nitroreductase family protein [Deltaproteobacteria bacterium]|nr:nitroreductase family protein [Deltaproteobacteria bacterium]
MAESPLMKIIRDRVSIRRYNPDQKVSRDLIYEVIEAARLAPSSQNSQTWRFVVIDEPALLKNFIAAIFKGAAKSNNWIKTAPAIILACSDKRLFADQKGFLLRKWIGKLAPEDLKYFELDVAIALEHAVLRATELGLGTCWVGWFDKKAAAKALQLPGGIKPIILTPIGYPAGTGPDTVEKIIHAFAKPRIRKKIEEILFFNGQEGRL